MSLELLYTPNIDTSESYDFRLTRNEIIDLAYEHIGVKGENQQLTPEQYSRGSKVLNAMVKNWAADEVYLWTNCWTNLTLQASNTVSVSGVDYGCIRNHTASLRTQPGVGEIWESFWTAATTTGASAWVDTTVYKSAGNYTLSSNIIGVDNARVKQDQGYTILNPMSSADYFSLGNPNVTGKPTRFYFRKELTPEVFLYPVPDDVTKYQIEIDIYKYPQDFDIGADDADFLQEWIEPLYLGLAVRLAPQEGIFGTQLNQLKQAADESKDIARSSDHEFGDFFIKPHLRNAGGING